MAGLVNQETNLSVNDFIESIENGSKRIDSQILLEIMEEVTSLKPRIWGNNFIIGFGKYKYKRKGGKEEFEWFHVGFAPRKRNLTIYLTFDVSREQDLLSKLGKHQIGKGCLYINKLADIDLQILRQLIEKSKTATWH